MAVSLSRIKEPVINKNVISRQRLTKKYLDNIERPFVLITGSAGAGKTVLSKELAALSGLKCLWLTCTEKISSAYQFLEYLIYSFREYKKDFGKNTQLLLESSGKKLDNDHIFDLVLTLCNDINNELQENLMLFIDDLHTCSDNDESIIYVVDSMLEEAPSNIKIIISTREFPGINVERLEAKRKLLRYSDEELRFTINEILSLIKHVYSIPDNDIVNNIYQFSEGWATGIHLIIQSYINNKNLPELKQKNVLEFFMKDVFEQLSDDIKQFAIMTSIPDEFSVLLCKEALNIDNPEHYINILIRKNIFIEHVSPGNEPNYRYQLQFREFLLNTFYDKAGKYYILIAEYFISRNEIKTAVKLLLDSGQDYDIAEILDRNVSKLFNEHEFNIIVRGYEHIRTSEQLKGNYYYMVSKFYLTGRSELLIELENSCKDEFINETRLLIADHLINNNKLEECKGMIDKIASPDKNIMLKTHLLNTRILIRKGFKYYREILNVTEKLLKTPAELKPEDKQFLYEITAHIYNDFGDYIKANEFYSASLKYEQNIYKYFSGLTNLVIINSYTGNYSQAYKFLTEAEDFYKKFPIKRFSLYLNRCRTKFYFEAGDYENSLLYLDKVLQEEFAQNNPVFRWAFTAGGCETYIYLKENDKARQMIEYASSVYNEDDYSKLMNEYLLKRIKFDKSSEKIFLKAKNFFIKNNLLPSIAQINFMLAKYYLRTGFHSTARQYFEESIGMLKEKGYISFIEQEAGIDRELFDFGIKNNIEKEFLNLILNNVSQKYLIPYFSDKAKSRFKKISGSMTDIDMKCFGENDIYLRGELLPEQKWNRKKSKLLLIYLLTNKSHKITKDEITDMFFEDEDISKAEVSMHSAIYNIRNTLKLYQNTTKDNDHNPEFIIYEEKLLKLNEDFNYSSDNLSFKELFSKAFDIEFGTKDRLNAAVEAISIYKGIFLPGYFDNWIEDMREEYKDNYVSLCEFASEEFFKNKQFKPSIEYSEKIIKTDNLNEKAYINIIRSYNYAGQHDNARKKYNDMLKIFETELGEKPERSVIKTIENILQ